MFDHAPIRVQKANRSPGVLGILALAILAIPSLGRATQQAPPIHHEPSQPEAANAALHQAEDLIQQGLFDQARKVIDEQLELVQDQ